MHRPSDLAGLSLLVQGAGVGQDLVPRGRRNDGMKVAVVFLDLAQVGGNNLLARHHALVQERARSLAVAVRTLNLGLGAGDLQEKSHPIRAKIFNRKDVRSMAICHTAGY